MVDISKDQGRENPQIQLVKGTMLIKKGLLVENQVSLMSIHSLSEVDIEGLSFRDTPEMQGPIIFSD